MPLPVRVFFAAIVVGAVIGFAAGYEYRGTQDCTACSTVR
jgi:hypothetical protein